MWLIVFAQWQWYIFEGGMNFSKETPWLSDSYKLVSAIGHVCYDNNT